MILSHYCFPFPVRKMLSRRLSLSLTFCSGREKVICFLEPQLLWKWRKHSDLWIEAVEISKIEWILKQENAFRLTLTKGLQSQKIGDQRANKETELCWSWASKYLTLQTFLKLLLYSLVTLGSWVREKLDIFA